MQRNDFTRCTVAVAAITLFPIVAASAPQASKPAPPKAGAARSAAGARALPTPGAGPTIVVETVRGTFELETYPDDAPKSVEHIVALVKRGFYNGQRVQRVSPGFVVQFGDPQTRDMTRREWWGRGDFAGSGRTIGVAEISKKHLHVRGAVALAHPGNPAEADSQMYVALAAQPKLNGKYAVIGRVTSGMDVAGALQVADIIKKVYLKPATAEPAKAP
jgi:cyclophilin family peptidyl-prolyl cis-trans isomerase